MEFPRLLAELSSPSFHSNLIGASRETVTLLIHKFEEIGLLRREGRDLFLNRERLADYLGLEGE